MTTVLSTKWNDELSQSGMKQNEKKGEEVGFAFLKNIRSHIKYVVKN